MSNQGVSEEELVANAKAPRIMKEMLEANVKSYLIFRPYESIKDAPVPEDAKLLTLCILSCWNGFTVVGESACADPANFDPDIGERLALENAKGKLWQLMGYELKSKVALVQMSIPRSFMAQKTYVGTKVVHAFPMNRREYNHFRNWELPKNENGDDEGYLVEYADGQ